MSSKKFEKRRFCALIGTALCAALVFSGAALFGDMPGEPQEPPECPEPCPSFDGYFVVLPSPPVLRRGFCVVGHSALGGATPGQERLAMELERDLTRTRTNAEVEWEADTKGPADEIFVKTKVKGTLNESQQARVDAIAASLEAGGEKAKIKIEVEVAPVEEVLAARAEIAAEQLSALAEIEALGKAHFGAAFELPAPRRRYDSLINAVLLDLPDELAGPAKALPGVRDVQPNFEMTPQMDVSVPVTGAELAHSASPPIVGTGIRVAVIDTGVDYTHPSLVGKVVNPTEGVGDVTPPPGGDGCPGLCGVDDDGDGLIDEDSSGLQPGEPGYTNDLVDDDDEDGFADNLFGIDLAGDTGEPDGDPKDDVDWEYPHHMEYHHGTHIASIIAGAGCLTGMAPEAQIVAVKIFKSVLPEGVFYDRPTMADVVDALDWVVNEVQPGAPEPRAEVANISLGARCGHPQDPASVAADSAVLNGVVVVAPSGGGNNLGINSPGTAANAITVTPYTLQQPGDLPDDFWAGGAEGYTRYTDPAVPPEDRALFKPDLVAPGVHGSVFRIGICAARTTLVDDFSGDELCPQPSCEVGSINYVFGRGRWYGSPVLSSIAAAHVSGAAALLLGENPLWTPYFDAGQNQVVNKVKDALVNRALLLDPTASCCPFFSIDCVRTCYARFLGVGNGRLMVKDAAGTGETGALDTDFLVRPSLLSFGEVTTCDDNIFREKILMIDDLVDVPGETFDVDITVDSITPSYGVIDVSAVADDEVNGLTPVTVTFQTDPADASLDYPPNGSNGYMGEIIITEKDSMGDPVGDPIRVPWFLAVRSEINRPPGQCQTYRLPIVFITKPGGGIWDKQLPADIGICSTLAEPEKWRVSACGFSADTKVCFGKFKNEKCTGKTVLKEPGSFCPTGGNTGATIDVVVPKTKPGTKVTVYDSCTSFNMGTVTYVDDEPGASFTYNAPKCVGEGVQFTDASTNFPRHWWWDFGDGERSSRWNPTHVYSMAGTYTVTLTVMNPCGSYDSSSDTVTILGPSFTHNAPKCAGDMVQFTDTSPGSPTQWWWDFGDGNTSTEQSPEHMYTSAGTYTVTLAVTYSAPNCPGIITFSDTVVISPGTAEPSATGVSPAVPPLTMDAAGAQVTVEIIPCATGYVVYENALGTWYGTPARSCTTAWTDNLDGTATFGYTPVNGDAWLMVGAWSAVGESSVGRDSAGVERNAQPGWPAPGPCP